MSGSSVEADSVSTALYVVGARQRAARSLLDHEPAWHGYDRGLVVRVEVDSGDAAVCFEYVSPGDVVEGPDAAISLHASTLHGDLLYTCTETEVLVYSLPDFDRVHYVSLPWFNDVHHIRPSPAGNLVVANAGLEMVLEVTPAGEVVNIWNVLFEDPWAAFDQKIDYRKQSTKPHRAHPNFVFYLGDELWATRFEQGDAVSLAPRGRSISVSDRRIHDGALHDGRLYFTTVDGTIVVIDADTLAVADVIDLNAVHGDRTVLGWCRGVLVEGERMWVGFSRIRPTRFRENVSWVARGFREHRPTRIACYDLPSRTCLTEIDLEPAGLSALYSILPADV